MELTIGLFVLLLVSLVFLWGAHYINKNNDLAQKKNQKN